MMRERTSFAAVLTSIGVTVGALSILGSAAFAQSGRPEMSEVTFGILPTSSYAPAVIAQQEGFFRQEGLNVNLRTVGPTSQITTLVNGEVHAGGMTIIALITAFNRGIDLTVVAEADHGAPGQAEFLVRADSSIQKLSDLLGKKVAVVTLNGNCDLLVNDVLRNQRLDYTQIRYVGLPIPDMGPMLERQGVDAACVPEPNLSIIKGQKNSRVIHDLFTGEHRGFPAVIFASATSFVSKNPNTASAIRRAIDKARQLAATKPEMVRAALPAFTNMKPELAATITLPEFPPNSDLGVVKRAADLMQRLKVLEGDIKVPRMVPDGK
jgi:NitT/TauT family transport system substrate-binding protein